MVEATGTCLRRSWLRLGGELFFTAEEKLPPGRILLVWGVDVTLMFRRVLVYRCSYGCPALWIPCPGKVEATGTCPRRSWLRLGGELFFTKEVGRLQDCSLEV